MKAENKPWCAGERIKLSDVLPLRTPITIGVEASSRCNLQCSYCVHGEKEKTFTPRLMDFDNFKKAIDSLKEFPDKVKTVTFALDGEPLTNPQLPEMVKYVRDSGVAERIVIFTNAVLLSPEMSTKLVEAGLDVLRISIQGLSDERYMELCGSKVKFEKIVSNIKYFYEHKGKCKVFVKIVDQSFNEENTEEKFYQVFGDICDQISVETIVPMRLEVDYEQVENSKHMNLICQEVEKSDVCAQPFYAMYIRADNNVTPCCIANSSVRAIGNIETQGLLEIWNSKKLKDLQCVHLLGKRYEINKCKECNYPECGMQLDDKIDSIAKKLYNKLID